MYHTFSLRQVFKYTLFYALGHRIIKIHPKNFQEGVWIRPRSTDFLVLYEIFTTRELEMEWPLPKPPRTIIDGGANVGYSTLAMSRRWRGVAIIAVEPDAGNAALLRKNVAHLEGVQVVEKGIWGFPCKLRVETASLQSGAWGLRFEPVCSDTIKSDVEAVSIDLLIKNLPEMHCDLLKLDVEGAEASIFAGQNVSWIDRVTVILVETHGREADQIVKEFANKHQMTSKKAGEKLMFWREDPGVPSTPDSATTVAC